MCWKECTVRFIILCDSCNDWENFWSGTPSVPDANTVQHRAVPAAHLLIASFPQLDAERSDFDEYTRALVRSVLEMVPPPDSRWFEWRADGAGGWTPFFKFGMHKGEGATEKT